MTTVTIETVNYTILAEIKLEGKCREINSNYDTLLSLRKPRGHKEFLAMRNKSGVIELV